MVSIIKKNNTGQDNQLPVHFMMIQNIPDLLDGISKVPDFCTCTIVTYYGHEGSLPYTDSVAPDMPADVQVDTDLHCLHTWFKPHPFQRCVMQKRVFRHMLPK